MRQKWGGRFARGRCSPPDLSLRHFPNRTKHEEPASDRQTASAAAGHAPGAVKRPGSRVRPGRAYDTAAWQKISRMAVRTGEPVCASLSGFANPRRQARGPAGGQPFLQLRPGFCPCWLRSTANRLSPRARAALRFGRVRKLMPEKTFVKVPSGDAAAFPVEVEIRLGSCLMPLSALRALQQGDTIQTTLQLPRAVATCAGKAFAEVELVDNDKTPALRIRSVSGD